MAVDAEIGALGQVFADQAVGVFVGSALPWGVWVAEVDINTKALREDLVQGHLGALVVGQGLAQGLGDGLQAVGEAVEDGAGVGAVDLGEHEEAAGSLDEGAHGRLIACALDEVALPVARHDACADLGRTQGDGGHVLKSCAGAIGPSSTRATPSSALSQELDQLGSEGAARHGVDGAVDGLVGHGEGVSRGPDGGVELESACKLLWRPAQAKPVEHMAPGRRLNIGAQDGAMGAGALAPV